MLLGASKAAGWELRAAAMPAFAGGEAVPTNSGSALFVLSQDPAKQRASWELIKFMTSDHAYTEISSKIGYLPLRTSLTTDPTALKAWADGTRSSPPISSSWTGSSRGSPTRATATFRSTTSSPPRSRSRSSTARTPPPRWPLPSSAPRT